LFAVLRVSVHHATGVSLEQEFRDGLKEIAQMDEARRENLSSALRLHVLRELREKT